MFSAFLVPFVFRGKSGRRRTFRARTDFIALASYGMRHGAHDGSFCFGETGGNRTGGSPIAQYGRVIVSPCHQLGEELNLLFWAR